MTAEIKKNALLKDSSIYISGEFISKAIPFFLLPYLTRKLGVEGFGELSYYQAILAFLLIFLGLSQHGAVARYYYFYGKNAINMIVTSGYLLNVLTSLLLIVIFLVMQEEMLIYVTLIAMFQTLISVQLSLRQCQKKALSYVALQLFFTVLNVVLTVILLEFFSENLVEKRLLAMLLSSGIAFSLFYFLYIKKIRKPFNYSKRQYIIGARYILFFGLPLFLHGFSSVVRTQFDKVLVYNSFSEADLGIYSAGFQLASVLSIAIMAINKAVVPYYYEALKKKLVTKDKVIKYFFISLFFIPVPALMAWLIPNEVYTWFLGSKFNESKYFMVVFLISMSVTVPYLVLVNYLFYYGKNLNISISSIVSTLIYVCLLLVLVNFGVRYLPYAGILAELCILPVLYFFVLRLDK